VIAVTTKKPIASLSLDLDNKWSYMKTHGDSGWESFPSYLDILVPRVLSFLKERKLTITFFVVGQDAAFNKNHGILKSIADAGHEIGNHSFHHEPWMHEYSRVAIETEIATAEDHIERATERKPIGFRGPGHNSLSCATLQVLARRGYLYDASTLPSLLSPLTRAIFFMTARLSPEQRHQRKWLGGTFSDGFRPIKPYRWRVDAGTLIEVPVTTMPIFKFPVHLTYLMCLRAFSPSLALGYFNAAIALCRLTGTQPSLLLHPTDFLGCDDTRALSFLPGMELPSEKKMAFVSEILHRLTGAFTVLTLQQHANAAAQISELPVVEPHFPNAMTPKQQAV
jgi:peptidoglycan-N-acetylglucosamine deacetylase